MYEEAINEMKKEEHYPKSFVYSYIGVIYNLMGNREKAYGILEEYKKKLESTKRPQKEKYSFYGLASLCFSLEEDNLGFDLLEKGYEARDPQMIYIKIDFLMDKVRRDPRFVSLVKRLNLD